MMPLWFEINVGVELKSDVIKNDFSEIMGFIRLFGTTYLKKVHTQNIGSLVH